MVIYQKEGVFFNFLNIIGVAIVIYFTWYLLNKFVPFNVKTSVA